MGCVGCGERVKVGRWGVAGTEGVEIWESDAEGTVVLCGRCAPRIMTSAASGERPAEMWKISVEGLDDTAAAWVDEGDLQATRRKADKVFDATGEELLVRVEDFAKRTIRY